MASGTNESNETENESMRSLAQRDPCSTTVFAIFIDKTRFTNDVTPIPPSTKNGSGYM